MERRIALLTPEGSCDWAGLPLEVDLRSTGEDPGGFGADRGGPT